MSASDSTLEIDAPEVAKQPARPAAAPQSRKAKGVRGNPPAPARQPAPPPAPPKTAAKQKPAPQADAAQAENESSEAEALGEEDTRPRWRALLAFPPWLVSMGVHLLLMVILAMIMIPPRPKPSGTVIQSVSALDEEVVLTEAIKMEVVDLQTPEMVTMAVTSSDLTSASQADVGALSAAPAELSSGDLEVPATDEVGDLFVGDSGKKMGVAVDGAAKQAAQFFGVKSTGRRFVFIVDSSNSMRGAKFEAAKEELLYSIRRLSKEQAFYILFFDHDAAKMTLPPKKEPELLCVPATTQNINLAEQWVKSVINEGRTDPFDCVEFALDITPDAIYLLTDGIFTDKGLTEQFLKKNNILDDAIDGRRPKVVINTVCFWDRAGEEPLQRIAKDYGGTYRYVPPARK